MYVKYYPSEPISLSRPNLTSSDNKLGIFRDKQSSAALQSTPPMGRTTSTTHRWLFRVSAASNYFYRKIGVCRWVGGELGKIGRLGNLMSLRKLMNIGVLRTGVRSKGAQALLKFPKLLKFLNLP